MVSCLSDCALDSMKQILAAPQIDEQRQKYVTFDPNHWRLTRPVKTLNNGVYCYNVQSRLLFALWLPT